MKKLLLIAMLVVGLCLVTVMGNCASYKDSDSITFSGKMGFARLQVEKKVFHFANIQPGERLAVTWWIKNTGPCPLEVKVDVRVTPGSLAPYLVPVFYPGYTLQMGYGFWKNVALTVKLKNNAPNWTANKDFWVTVTFKSTAKGTRWQSPGYDTW